MTRTPRLVAVTPPEPEHEALSFIPSGGHTLDLVLGGGWAQGRVANIVGDSSTGKTLLAIEACANFARTAQVTDIRYVETEAAFDLRYAESIGMPKDLEPKRGVRTVEAFHDDLKEFIESRGDRPCLYVLDSLDALSDAGELERDMDKGSYGAEKAKKLSQLFRMIIQSIDQGNCTLLLVSQIREKIGVMFGERYSRSGGKSLDFYASQIIWLAQIEKVKVTRRGQELPLGIIVKVRNKKNKVGVPYRQCDLKILFNYGIDDQDSMIAWLERYKALEGPAAELRKELSAARNARDRAKIDEMTEVLKQTCSEVWQEIEQSLKPPLRKYDD